MTEKFETEAAQARLERIIIRMWRLCVMLIIAFLISNLGWLIYEATYDTEKAVISQDVDTESGEAIVYDGIHYGVY